MTGKHLNKLLQGIVPIASDDDRVIMGLTQDSRTVKEGYLFFARHGTQAEGKNYIHAAIQNGAVAILSEVETGTTPSVNHYKNDEKSVPIYSIPDLDKNLGLIAARFFDEPAKAVKMIGITGTNGKTSCSHFIAACLNKAGYKSGVIGTLGHGVPGHLQNANNTTPNQIELQQLLATMVAENVKYIAMEVSSHGLVQNRVSGIPFEIGIFTNITRDHLDYHGSMENYAAAKRLLFLQPGLHYAVINADDAYGQRLIDEFQQRMPVYAYSTTDHVLNPAIQQIRAHQVKLDISGIAATIHTPWGDGVLHSRLLGRFNLSNLLAVLTTLCILGIHLEAAIDYISQLNGIPGRMELFGGGEQPLVVVDYAHTPDALMQSLTALKEYAIGDIWCVFGCGGDRDRGKRPQMGAIVEQYADHMVVTDDNPRHEDRKAIVADILAGMQRPKLAVIEHDRQRAIAHAISCAHQGDIVLVAGKGHESYQQIGAEMHPFNDALTVQMILAGT